MSLLRRLTVADAELLSEIGGITLIESHGHSAPAEVMQAYKEKAFSLETCRAELADGGNVFYGAFYNGQAAGYSKIIFNEPHPAVQLQPVTKLERLYLLSDYYDKKLGHRLLEKAVALSKAQGDKGMWLDVWKKNERAVRFYEKQGFETVGESAFVLTETHSNPIWVMVLKYLD
ncbi:GNAT family N-acetyltransferase [Flavisolibacter ginsenosidimutans]|nr:GNAT family N-acetyltransferase [Flavisolibacter ginsenosidimutans]